MTGFLNESSRISEAAARGFGRGDVGFLLRDLRAAAGDSRPACAHLIHLQVFDPPQLGVDTGVGFLHATNAADRIAESAT